MPVAIPDEVHKTKKSLIWVFDRTLDAAEQKGVEAQVQKRLSNARLVVEFKDVERDFTMMIAYVRDSR